MSTAMDTVSYNLRMKVDISFGEWLEDQLVERGWSQSGFAELIDVSRSSINAWVNNRKTPHKTICRRIAKAFNVDPDEVLVRAGHEPRTLGYELPDSSEPASPDIDLDDPLIQFATSSADKLTDAQKQAIIEIIRQMRHDEFD